MKNTMKTKTKIKEVAKGKVTNGVAKAKEEEKATDVAMVKVKAKAKAVAKGNKGKGNELVVAEADRRTKHLPKEKQDFWRRRTHQMC